VEVLLAIAIMGFFLTIALRFLVEQWVVTGQIKDELEVQYTLIVSQRVITEALRSSQSAEWDGGVLKIKPWSEPTITDLYYLDDKDGDGILDLYREHLNVANPLVSGVKAWKLTPLTGGLWEIYLEAQTGTKTSSLKTYLSSPA